MNVMNSSLMFSSRSDDWETPIDLFNILDSEFHFTLDACASLLNAKCPVFYSKDQDSLLLPWNGIVWCNPPYGRNLVRWVEKAYSSLSLTCPCVVMLLPARTDTIWFHKFIYNKQNVEIRFLKGRLKFGNCLNPAPFPSMIVIFKY